MSKPVWTHTHNGEKNEELFECEGKYYERFAWDHFLAAYTGKVRRVGRDRPGPHNGWDSAWSPSVAGQILDFAKSTQDSSVDFFSDGQDLWPADETTDPMPQPVIRPRQLTPVAPLQKKDKP